MYTEHYRLREKPFALTPDPRFLYLSDSHREALAHLLYGIEQGEGFIAVTGEVGTGKTTLCRTLLERIEDDYAVAYLFDPCLDGHELLGAICRELDLPAIGSRTELQDRIDRFLLDAKRRGRGTLLLVDEAQHLSPDTLEQLRLLSNLETETEKLLQIVLFGQPELDALLATRGLRQLRQRIGVRWQLAPLSEAEAEAYVRHRVRVAQAAAGAGATPRAAAEDLLLADSELFTAAALRELRRRSRGVPRLLNLLADRALLAGYAGGARQVDRAHVSRAAREILSVARSRRRLSRWGASKRSL